MKLQETLQMDIWLPCHAFLPFEKKPKKSRKTRRQLFLSAVFVSEKAFEIEILLFVSSLSDSMLHVHVAIDEEIVPLSSLCQRKLDLSVSKWTEKLGLIALISTADKKTLHYFLTSTVGYSYELVFGGCNFRQNHLVGSWLPSIPCHFHY